MISLDEIQSTLNRLTLLQNNTDDIHEQFMCFQLVQNITPMIKQLTAMKDTPEFNKFAEDWKAQMKPQE